MKRDHRALPEVYCILGASGYVGGELLRLLTRHPRDRATRLFDDSKAGKLAPCTPHVGGAIASLTWRIPVDAWTASIWSSPPFLMASAKMRAILASGAKLVDLVPTSAAHQKFCNMVW